MARLAVIYHRRHGPSRSEPQSKRDDENWGKFSIGLGMHDVVIYLRTTTSLERKIRKRDSISYCMYLRRGKNESSRSNLVSTTALRYDSSGAVSIIAILPTIDGDGGGERRGGIHAYFDDNNNMST
jgi:hypothetical protein